MPQQSLKRRADGHIGAPRAIGAALPPLTVGFLLWSMAPNSCCKRMQHTFDHTATQPHKQLDGRIAALRGVVAPSVFPPIAPAAGACRVLNRQ